MSLIKFKDRLKKITHEQMLEVLRQIVRDNEKLIIDANRLQLMEGRGSSGELLEPEYTEKTARKKGQRNPNLYDTGQFQNNFFLVDEAPLIIFSYDEKASLLVQKYGEHIFGLTPDNAKELAKICREKYIEYQRKLLEL